MLGPRSQHGADMGTQAAHPAADTIQPVPQAVVIGVATAVAMATAGVVVQPVEPVVWVGAATAATAMAAAGEHLLPAAVTTTMPAVAAVDTIIGRLLLPAAAIIRRAALRAAGTRIFG